VSSVRFVAVKKISIEVWEGMIDRHRL